MYQPNPQFKQPHTEWIRMPRTKVITMNNFTEITKRPKKFLFLKEGKIKKVKHPKKLLGDQNPGKYNINPCLITKGMLQDK